MRIKAIFFDLGNTLITADNFLKKDTLKLNQKLFRSIGYNISLKELEKSDKNAVDYMNSKFRGKAKIHEKGFYIFVLCKLLGLDINREIINKLHEKYREKHHSSFHLLPNTRKILSFLKNRGYKLAIISNGSVEGVNRIIDNLKLRNYFNLVVISESIGKEKCTSIPFKIALEELRLKPQEVIVVGDRLDEDILGAKKLGIITVKHNYGIWKDVNYSNERIEPDFIIRNLLELKYILSELNGTI